MVTVDGYSGWPLRKQLEDENSPIFEWKSDLLGVSTRDSPAIRWQPAKQQASSLGRLY